MLTDDPILVRWGLHDLLDAFETTDDRTSVQSSSQVRTEYIQPGESYPVQGYSSIENDEMIAHALQEEFSHRAPKDIGESESCHDWYNCTMSSRDAWQTEETTRCDTSSNNESDSGLDDCNVPVFFEDFAAYDGEVGRRLTHMDSIPHVPKINGEIPTMDDASDAHQRLLDRLKEYGLSELKVEGDGNCQFRAFSDQLYRSSVHHKSVREDVVNQLKSHPDWYEGYVPMKYSEYVKKMSKCGEWGDHVTLQAAADYYGVRICLLTSFKDTSFVQILPRETKSKRVIFLSFWAEVHYNSVYPEGDVPLFSGKPKHQRRWQHYLQKLRL